MRPMNSFQVLQDQVPSANAAAPTLEDLIRKDSAKTSNVNVTTAADDSSDLNNALAFDSGKFSAEKNTRRPSATIDNLAAHQGAREAAAAAGMGADDEMGQDPSAGKEINLPRFLVSNVILICRQRLPQQVRQDEAPSLRFVPPV